MPEITITVADTDYRVLCAALDGPDKVRAWVANAVRVKAGKRRLAMLAELDDRQPHRIPPAEQDAILNAADLAVFQRRCHPAEGIAP